MARCNAIPTLLGNDGTGAGNYLNDHPVGLNAVMGCGGPYDWDCTISATGAVQMTGANSSKFVTNYGFFVSPGIYNNTARRDVHHLPQPAPDERGQCDHRREVRSAGGHLRNHVLHSRSLQPGQRHRRSNQTAQFCRQCHGGEANEMNGGTAVTTF